LCETEDVPKPDAVNVRVEGILCDAVYYEAKVIVELDGVGNHHSPAQIRRDRANDLKLRAHGWLVLRYSWYQLHEQPAVVAEELLRVLAARAAG
jgi:very-short-patch-repair endonuclease